MNAVVEIGNLALVATATVSPLAGMLLAVAGGTAVVEAVHLSDDTCLRPLTIATGIDSLIEVIQPVVYLLQ